jgi:hypothetical protein
MTKNAIQLVPSILATNFARLGQQVAELEQAGANRIHVDVMDGTLRAQSFNGGAHPPVAATGNATALGDPPDDIESMFLEEFAHRLRFPARSLGSNHNLHRTVQRLKARQICHNCRKQYLRLSGRDDGLSADLEFRTEEGLTAGGALANAAPVERVVPNAGLPGAS